MQCKQSLYTVHFMLKVNLYIVKYRSKGYICNHFFILLSYNSELILEQRVFSRLTDSVNKRAWVPEFVHSFISLPSSLNNLDQSFVYANKAWRTIKTGQNTIQESSVQLCFRHDFFRASLYPQMMNLELSFRRFGWIFLKL